MSGPPPPPPMSGLGPQKPVAPSNSASSGGGDKRGALLSQIQMGTKLKKVTTVDKSTPLVAGKIAGSSQASSPVKSSKSSPDSSMSSPVSSRGAAAPKGFMSLTDELQQKLTLKKNKQSPVKETTIKEASPPNFLNEIKSKQQLQQNPYHQAKSQSSTSVTTNNISSPNLSDVIPNKSSLFNTQKSQANVAAYVPLQGQPKLLNYGKPNLAPKPPAQLSLALNDNNSNSSDRKSVARHQSMKSPRSPPIASLSSPENHFATIRSPSNHNKIQDALNLQLSSQKPVAQRPTNKPPPPPVPNRNLTTQMHAKSTTALNNMPSDLVLNASRRIPNTEKSGSSNNVSDAVDAPPLPPHRVTSRVLQTQQTTPNIQAIPPEVPRRHSSMRNSENGIVVSNNQNNNRFPSPNTNQPITRLVVDLEARYSLLFHSLSEFPPPKQFMNIFKSYPSIAVRPSNGII